MRKDRGVGEETKGCGGRAGTPARVRHSTERIARDAFSPCSPVQAKSLPVLRNSTNLRSKNIKSTPKSPQEQGTIMLRFFKQVKRRNGREFGDEGKR
jgi:hypothetical protein